MEKKELYDSFDQLTAALNQITATVEKLKEATATAIEKNAELEIENEHLHERLAELGQQENTSNQAATGQMTQSRRNLERLYNEGFHVCNNFYGKRRKNDEPCAFCVTLIYGEQRA